jgi:hypothetical protein
VRCRQGKEEDFQTSCVDEDRSRLVLLEAEEEDHGERGSWQDMEELESLQGEE